MELSKKVYKNAHQQYRTMLEMLNIILDFERVNQSTGN